MYYNANIPVVGKYGINSGILFMKLIELRRFEFVKKIIEIKNNSKFQITGDQDMINILFHKQTGKLKFKTFTINIFVTFVYGL